MGYERRERKDAKGSSNKSKGGGNAYAKHKYLNPYVSDADKQYLDDNSDSYEERIMQLLEYIGDEYALRVAHDANSGRWNCTLTPLLDDSVNSGFILSYRGATPTDGLYVLHYLHVVKADGVWSTIVDTSSNSSRW